MGCKNGKEGKRLNTNIRVMCNGKKLLDEFSLGALLGQGGYGTVYECTSKETGQVFAVKMVDQVETAMDDITLEVKYLTMLEHPRVTKFIDVFYEKVFVCMVLELYKGGNLVNAAKQHWKDKGMLSNTATADLVRMAMEGVEWLHSKDIVHRDLKGDNYLVDRDCGDPGCQVYLSDFGTVCPCPPGTKFKNRCGTRNYWAPELWDSYYGREVDVWAIGVVMYSIHTLRFPYNGEQQTKHLEVVSERLDKDGADVLSKLFTRKADSRPTAKAILALPGLQPRSKPVAEAQLEAPLEVVLSADLNEAEPDVAVQARRLELLQRLEVAAMKPAMRRSLALDPDANLTRSFMSQDVRRELVANFEWWDSKKVENANFYSSEAPALSAEESLSRSLDASMDSTRHVLRRHGLSTGTFGSGIAKQFVDLAREVNSGESRLMLDASQRKKLVRVVCVVLLRVVHGEGINKKYLIKTTEVYPDGRERKDINQLTGNKRLPHENGMRCVQRMLKERMPTLDGKLTIDWKNKECFEEEDESPSFPGLRTVYRKEIYEAKVTTTDPGVLQSMGLREQGSFSEKDKRGYTRTFEWLNEKQCTVKQIMLHAPEEGSEISVLVDPSPGFSEEDLNQFLESSNVDISQFGHSGVKSLAEFTEEFVRGDATMDILDGQLTRIVELVVLHIVNADGHTLVEASSTRKGHTIPGARLPAQKRRSDENPFWTAQRLISQTLKLNENCIHMDEKGVLDLEETRTSEGFAGLKTLYRRKIICAEAMKI